MAHKSPETLRNVAVIGHRGCGKTSLVEAMLFTAGITNRLGRVADGTTVADFDDDEKRRGTTIAASLCHLPWMGAKINVLDTPGEPSFHADTLSVLPAVDAALMVVNSASGVETQTRRLWQRCDEMGLPRAIVVNMLDRERSDFDATVSALQEMAPGCVAVNMPIGSQEAFRGVVNLVSMTATTYEPGSGKGVTGEIPDDLREIAAAARERLIESIAEADDELIERYLSGQELSTEELIRGLCEGVREGRLFPVLCASGDLVFGVDRILDLIVECLPSPVAAASRRAQLSDGTAVEIGVSDDGPAVAYCFKTLADPFSGRINLMRVFTGVLGSDSHAYVGPREAKERIGQLFTLQGKDHVAMSAIGPGDIGGVAKLKELHTGDALASHGPVPRFPAPALPAAVMSFAVSAVSQADEDKMYSSLRRLCDEDPTLDVHRDEQTAELIVAGLSQLHVEVVTDRLERRFGVAVELHAPRVPYRETISGVAEAEGKHKKQSGGRGQYGDCWVRVEPLARGEGFEFVDKIVGGAIPRGFIPAVEKGIVEAMASGEIGGYPVVDVKVTLYDGKFHAVDSSEMAFKIAGSLAMRAALGAAHPVLLEPVMNVTITVPTENVGDVMGDLSSRRGHPLGMEVVGEMEVVHAEVPMSEMLSYAPDLRAMTGGQGEYSMELARYDEMPAHLMSRAVATAVA